MLKKSLLLITLSLTLSTDLLVTTLAVSAKPARTTTTKVKPQPSRPASKPARRRVIGFKVPRVRTSANLEAGAARGKGTCAAQPISAVLSPKPLSMKIAEFPVELTVSDRPTFFVNVPETSATRASFLLKDDKEQILLEKTLSLTSTSGILAYTLPADFEGLKADKKYTWRLSLLCDPTGVDRSGDAKAAGWIQLKKPDQPVTKQLEAATDPLERAAIYADNGYFQDSLKALADLRAANPNDPDLATNWAALFKTVYLPQLAQQPVIQLEATTPAN